MDYHDLRRDFGRERFDLQLESRNPLESMKKWIDEAVAAGIPEANAMVLSTSDNKGPSSRVVLLKEITPEGGLVFYSDYHSRKGKAIDANPRVAVLFFWRETERQLRIEGTAHKTTAEKSEKYFNSRPLDSRASAVISRQSESIAGFEFLLNQREKLLKNPGMIRRPGRWGGYVIVPDRIEFWQGGRYRLHYRVQFILKAGEWTKEVLAP